MVPAYLCIELIRPGWKQTLVHYSCWDTVILKFLFRLNKTWCESMGACKEADTNRFDFSPFSRIAALLIYILPAKGNMYTYSEVGRARRRELCLPFPRGL